MNSSTPPRSIYVSILRSLQEFCYAQYCSHLPREDQLVYILLSFYSNKFQSNRAILEKILSQEISFQSVLHLDKNNRLLVYFKTVIMMIFYDYAFNVQTLQLQTPVKQLLYDLLYNGANKSS